MQVFEPSQALGHLCDADATLARIIAAVGPFTLQREPHGFYTLVDAIVSQQISVKAAAAIMARVAQAAAPLGPVTLLELGPERLRGLGLSNQKARYVLDLAARAADGRLDLDHLAALDDEAVVTELTRVTGIGRWTAEMYLIFALGRPDVLPVADLGLRQAVQRAYGLADLPQGPAIQALAAPWRPYRSVATWYLWRSLGNTPNLVV